MQESIRGYAARVEMEVWPKRTNYFHRERCKIFSLGRRIKTCSKKDAKASRSKFAKTANRLKDKEIWLKIKQDFWIQGAFTAKTSMKTRMALNFYTSG